MQRTRCPNFNHGRMNAPVRYCPVCGEVVNKTIGRKACGDEEHARMRREQNKHCVDCGAALIEA